MNIETVQVLKSVWITFCDECISFLLNPINFDLSSSLPKKYRKKSKKGKTRKYENVGK